MYSLDDRTRERLASLVLKCIDNGLTFQYLSHIKGIMIYKPYQEIGIEQWDSVHITNGYIGDWKYESPEMAVKRMSEEVDDYLHFREVLGEDD